MNLFNVDANFYMGPRWIFIIDGQFLTILRELISIFASIFYLKKEIYLIVENIVKSYQIESLPH